MVQLLDPQTPKVLQRYIQFFSAKKPRIHPRPCSFLSSVRWLSKWHTPAGSLHGALVHLSRNSHLMVQISDLTTFPAESVLVLTIPTLQSY